MLKKIWLSFSLIILLGIGLQTSSYATTKGIDTSKDSRILMYNDMLMLVLNEKTEEAVNKYYFKKLNQRVVVYPYDMDVIKIKRLKGFRGFDFLITIETQPVIGAHNSVGKDRLTFEMSSTVPETGNIKLIEYQHLKSYNIPSYLRD
ncbi:DUF3888 domain-containing protein [Priestia aryabhattai]|uniref:DUF3888 domain-containing protein n=1 Tax=Priestia aryabhattai TaxID=412384 RepID=UPI0039A3CB39